MEGWRWLLRLAQRVPQGQQVVQRLHDGRPVCAHPDGKAAAAGGPGGGPGGARLGHWFGSVPVRSLGAPSALPGRWMVPPEVPGAPSERVALVPPGGTLTAARSSPEPCAGGGAGGWRAAGQVERARLDPGQQEVVGGTDVVSGVTRPTLMSSSLRSSSS